MTFQEWFMQLIDPVSLVTETIYNFAFEIAVTSVFVRIYMKRQIAKEVQRILEEEKNKTN